MTGKHNWFDVLNVILLFAFALLMLFPFYHMFSLSTSSGPGLASGHANYIPVDFNLHAYRMVLEHHELLTSYYNSVRYAVVGTVIYLLATSLVAYPLTMRFWLNTPATIVYVLTMFISGGLVPTYLLYRTLGLIDTMWAFIFPGLVSFFYLIMLRTSIEQIAEELIESAVIDGANDVQIFVNVVVPLSKAIIATVALWAAVTQWNNYFGPVLYLSDVKKYPLQVVLRNLIATTQLQEMAETQAAMMETVEDLKRLRARMKTESLKAAVIVISALPILIVYPFIQRYFVKGAMIGAIKG